MTSQALYDQALSLHQSGRLAEAEPLYRQVLAAEPRHFDGLHLLGVIHYQKGEYPEAVRRIDAALKINPNAAAAHNNRGSALKDLGQAKEALASYERAIALKADYAEAFYNRGNVLRELARFGDAAESYERAAAFRPNYPEAFNNRGSALKALERHHAFVRRELLRFRGREVDTAGDGFFATFDGPARAIRCARSIVDGVHDLGLAVRAGLHTGECEVADGKVSGIAVHTGARVAAQALADEVLVSSTVKDLVAGSGITFAERGVRELKGIPGEWRLFAVDAT